VFGYAIAPSTLKCSISNQIGNFERKEDDQQPGIDFGRLDFDIYATRSCIAMETSENVLLHLEKM
jgi:hypothetical protein